MSVPPIAVIISCRDQGRVLETGIGSLLEQPASFELIVRDDGSSDLYTRQVLARLERHGYRVVRGGRPGGAVMNAAVGATCAPSIALLSPVDRVNPQYLSEAAARLVADPDVAFVSVSAVLQPIEMIAHGVVPAAPVIRRSTVEAIGGFRADLGAEAALDFWLTMTARRFRGVTLGTQPWQSLGLTAPEWDRLYRLRALEIAEQADALLLAKERHILELKVRRDAAQSRKSELAAELASLQQQFDRLSEPLSASGRSAISFGDLRRTQPISAIWGLDRGIPLDRYYIHHFLDRHRRDIRGDVLEVKDPGYTQMFGDDRVRSSQVVDIDCHNPQATIVADLTDGAGLSDDSYDCILLTQTLGLIYDARSALRTAARILKPGGVLLATVPASGRISYEADGLDGDHWRFNEASTRKLFAEVFPPEAFDIAGFGNVLASTAFLYGLAPGELSTSELDVVDPFFPIVYGIRAVKPIARRIVVTPDGDVALLGPRDAENTAFIDAAGKLLRHDDSLDFVVAAPPWIAVDDESAEIWPCDPIAVLAECPPFPALLRANAAALLPGADRARGELSAPWAFWPSVVTQHYAGVYLRAPGVTAALVEVDEASTRSVVAAYREVFNTHALEILLRKDERVRPLLAFNYDLERAAAARRTPVQPTVPADLKAATRSTSGVAVVIPCFNQASTIREAVESAINQSRPTAEIVVVDDGSSDPATKAVLLELSREGTRVVSTANQGLARARNHGIRLTTAPYVTTLDGDDRLDPRYIEQMTAVLDSDPALGFVSCALHAFEGADYVWIPNGDLVGGLVKGSLHASTMFRRPVFDLVGGFDPAMRAFETSDFWATALTKGIRGQVLPEPLVWYRVRDRSKYHTVIGRGHFAAARRALLDKHRDAVVDHLEEMVVQSDAFVGELTRHRDSLLARRSSKGPAVSNGIAVPILLYHRVGTVNSDARRISLSPDLFREQMRWLRDHCDVVPLETLAAAIGCGRLPDRTAVITFDDGYFDVLTTVLPILAEFNLPATFFVNSANFDAGDEFWGDILERVFLEGTAIPEECPLPFAGDDSVLRTVTADERRAAWERINAAVYPLGAAERIRVVNAIASWSQLDLDARPSHRRMTAEEVAGLARAPHYEIGAHTVNHLRLTDHALDVRRHEIAANKRDLERATGRVVRSFAYPYGIYDDATVALVREAGFATAVTVDRGVARAESDPWRLPRVEPPAVDASRFSVFMRDIVAQDSDQS